MAALLNAAPGHVSFTELLASVGGSGLARVGGYPYATSSESGRNGARFSGVGGIEFVEADAEDGEAGAPCSFGIQGIRLIEGDAEGSEAEPPVLSQQLLRISLFENTVTLHRAHQKRKMRCMKWILGKTVMWLIYRIARMMVGAHINAPWVTCDTGASRCSGGQFLPTIDCPNTAPPSYRQRCRPPRGMGAVQIAMPTSSTRSSEHIFQPTLGLTFDSVAQAYEFYNLYSWEVGFGIRLGSSNTNRGNNYRTMQEIERGNAGFDRRCQYQSQRCRCKAMIRLLRTNNHGWYVSLVRNEICKPFCRSAAIIH